MTSVSIAASMDASVDIVDIDVDELFLPCIVDAAVGMHRGLHRQVDPGQFAQ